MITLASSCKALSTNNKTGPNDTFSNQLEKEIYQVLCRPHIKFLIFRWVDLGRRCVSDEVCKVWEFAQQDQATRRKLLERSTSRLAVDWLRRSPESQSLALFHCTAPMCDLPHNPPCSPLSSVQNYNTRQLKPTCQATCCSGLVIFNSP